MNKPTKADNKRYNKAKIDYNPLLQTGFLFLTIQSSFTTGVYIFSGNILYISISLLIFLFSSFCFVSYNKKSIFKLMKQAEDGELLED